MTAWESGRPILTAAETRAAEQALFDRGMSVDALMHRAGEAVAEVVLRHAGPLDTLVLCGPGNNGGDGYVVARLLKARGVAVRVAASGEPQTDVARRARAQWDGPVEPLGETRPASLLIDALFGTGLTRGLSPDVVQALTELVAGSRISIAVDLPSGVSTDDGICLNDALPCFDITVALGVLKPSHRLRPAADHVGRVVVADIGLPFEAERLREIGQPRLGAPGPADHKYSRGMVAVVAGEMPGAALLSATSAQRAGAGYVVLAGAGNGAGGPMALVHRDLATALEDDRIGALVLGPGLGRDGEARSRLSAGLASDLPLILDADALVLLGHAGLSRLARRDAMAVLTPHEGEFARMFPDIGGDRLGRARAGAAAAGAVLLLKGSDSIVAHPDGRAMIAPPASPWLASAGTGDVLAGIIAAMRARGLDAFDAACAGCWLHAQAARLAGAALIADDLVDAIPRALEACL